MGKRRGRPVGRREDMVQVVCPACGGLRDDGSLIDWHGDVMCVRCSVAMLEEELHGSADDHRREARAMNDERRFADVREASELRGERVVRDW